jgi:hypothetical protein
MDAQTRDGPFGVDRGYNKRCSPFIAANPEWDLQRGPALLRIMTLNLAGRPPNLVTKLANNEAPCSEEYNLQQSQELRMRQILNWLDSLHPASLRPHVICFQELMCEWMRAIADDGLRARGYETHKAIDPASDNGCQSAFCFPPRAGSGLAIYVHRRSGLKIVDAGREIFEMRIGLDHLSEKGFAWALVCSSNPLLGRGHFVVMTCHPQAFMRLQIAPQNGAGLGDEAWWARVLRWFASVEQSAMGGYPISITRAHEAQFAQMGAFIRHTLLKKLRKQHSCHDLLGLFIAGDMNVNRYAAAPDSAAESDEPRGAASRCCSREFTNMLRALDCDDPPIVIEPTPHVSVRTPFTWNTRENDLARGVVHDRPAYAWIDYVLSYRGSSAVPKPLYMDQRPLAVRAVRPYPELSRFWHFGCTKARSQYAHAILAEHGRGPASRSRRVKSCVAANKQYAARLRLGHLQLEMIRRRFRAGMSAGMSWEQFVQAQPYHLSSQVWKGAQWYGFDPSDHNLRDSAFEPEYHPRWIGQPHSYRMCKHLSDHHAVLARIRLPTP